MDSAPTTVFPGTVTCQAPVIIPPMFDLYSDTVSEQDTNCFENYNEADIPKVYDSASESDKLPSIGSMLEHYDLLSVLGSNTTSIHQQSAVNGQPFGQVEVRSRENQEKPGKNPLVSSIPSEYQDSNIFLTVKEEPDVVQFLPAPESFREFNDGEGSIFTYNASVDAVLRFWEKKSLGNDSLSIINLLRSISDSNESIPLVSPKFSNSFAETQSISSEQKVFSSANGMQINVPEFPSVGILQTNSSRGSEQDIFSEIKNEVGQKKETETDFRCTQCNKSFAYRRYLVSHLLTHPDNKPHKCNFCEKRFCNTSNLINHIRIHTGEKPFNCQFCEKPFRRKCDLIVHVRTHTRDSPYQCQLCGHKSMSYSNSIKHNEMHSRRESLQLFDPVRNLYEQSQKTESEKSLKNPASSVVAEEFAAKFASDESNMGTSIHVETETVELETKIEDHPMNFSDLNKDLLKAEVTSVSSESSFVPAPPKVPVFSSIEDDPVPVVSGNSQELHFGEFASIYLPGGRPESEPTSSMEPSKSFKCLQCPKWFKSLSLLKSHILTHPGQKPYKCPHCDKFFCNTGNLKSHIRVHTGEKPFKCEYCSKPFRRQTDLAVHRRQHTGEKPYVCLYCGRAFSSHNNWKKHEILHSQTKQYKCNLCDKAFSILPSLKLHAATHVEDKAFECFQCKKGFATKLRLRAHIMIHTGERPFKCLICNKGFRQSTALKSHQLTHTGEKPEICGTCGASFARRDQLKLHQKSHSGSVIDCDFCHKTFVRKDLHQKHLRRIHPEFVLTSKSVTDNGAPLGRTVENKNIQSSMLSEADFFKEYIVENNLGSQDLSIHEDSIRYEPVSTPKDGLANVSDIFR